MAAIYGTFAGQIVHEERGGVERVYVPDPLGSTAMLVDAGGNEGQHRVMALAYARFCIPAHPLWMEMLRLEVPSERPAREFSTVG